MPVRRFVKTKWGLVSVVAALLIGAYALVGFLIVPRVLRTALMKDLPATLGVLPRVGSTRCNPFLLRLDVADFALRSPAGQPIFGFERLLVTFDVASLWLRDYSFRAIELTAPYVNAVVDLDGTVNLERLARSTAAPPFGAPQPRQTDAPLPALRIGSFKVVRGSLAYLDRRRPDAASLRLEPIDFDLSEFSTGRSGGNFTLTGISKRGERLDWQGHVAVQPLESAGELRIADLRAQTLWEFIRDRVNFEVSSGTLGLTLRYRFEAGRLQLDVADGSLEALAVRPRAGDQDWLTVPGLHLTGAHVDVAERRARVEHVAIEGLNVVAWLEPDGSLNLQRLAPVDSPVPLGPPVPVGATAGAAAPWRFDVPQIDIDGATVALEDRSTHPAAHWVLAPLKVRVSSLSQDLTHPLTLQIDTHLNDSGVVSLRGTVTPQPGTADLAVNLGLLDLRAVQPYLAPHTALTVVSGTLGGALSVHVGRQRDVPALKVAGDLRVDHFHSVDDTLQQDFINWDRLELAGISYSQDPDRLNIAQIAVRKPYVRAVIEADDSMNFERVMTAAPAGVAAPNAGQRRMPIAIQKVTIDSGQASFADLSVEPHFSSGINLLNGSISNISTAAGSRATLDLKGQVDAFAPVTLTGQFNVLGPSLFTDVDLHFRNISLPILDPYSDKFAGYDISEGKLSTEFHYQIDGRKLDAQHHLVIERLEFGAKTDSKQAVSLPIKFAVALLKDRNGTIDMNLPVTGSLDDPDFRLGGLIRKACVDLLMKAVTSPFALLGAVLGAGPDIQFIDFQPGQSGLDAAAIEKAKSVARALGERPSLAVEVPIAVVPDVDRPALAEAQFTDRLHAVQATAKTSATPLELLTRMYTETVGAAPALPAALAESAKLDFLGRAIRDHIHVGEADLTTLGQQRALALQQALLADSELAAERVFLVNNDKATVSDGRVRLELSVK